jgi:hypothetical protein
MRLILSRRSLHLLLALLLLGNSLLTLAQGSDHSLTVAAHSHHDVAHHHHNHADMHHVTAIESGPDEHGCHFHVHLSVHALVAAFSPFDYEAAAPATPTPLPLQLPSLTYAPPVPPPNA